MELERLDRLIVSAAATLRLGAKEQLASTFVPFAAPRVATSLTTAWLLCFVHVLPAVEDAIGRPCWKQTQFFLAPRASRSLRGWTARCMSTVERRLVPSGMGN